MTIAIAYPKFTFVVATFLPLVFAPPQAEADSDPIIKQAIEEMATNTPELQGANVRIAVEARRVILYGSVCLYLHKMLYEEISWQSKGVVEVANEIQVVPLSPLSDAAIERSIRKIITLHKKLHLSGLSLTVERGAVFFHATFDLPQDVIFLKKRIAAIEGVIEITMDNRFRT